MASSSLLFAMHEHHHDHPNNLQIECNAFCVSGHVIGFLLWEGSGNKDLKVVVQWNFLFQVFVRWLPLLREVLRWRGYGEWRILLLSNNPVCLSGIALIIYCSRVLAFNCSLKTRSLFCNGRYRLAFSSSRLEGHFEKAHRPYCPVSLA